MMPALGPRTMAASETPSSWTGSAAVVPTKISTTDSAAATGPALHKSERYRELDAIRGLAACAVVLFHFTVRYFELFPGPSPPFSARFGSFGVEVFFGISGFVILMTLERTRTAKAFLVSRLSRLYPAYWVCVAITFTVTQLYPLGSRSVTAKQALVNLTMWQEVFHVPHVDGVYWSLQIELIFYVLMILVLSAGWLRHARWLLIAWLVLSILCQGVSRGFDRPVPYLLERYLLLAHCGYFVIGAAAYLDFRLRRVSPMTWASFALALTSVALWSGVSGLVVTAGMVVLFTLLVQRRAALLDNRILVFLGTISYPLYLLHQNIGYVLIELLRARGFGVGTAIVGAIVAALVLGTLVTFFVERPALRWIRSLLLPAAANLNSAPTVSRP